ncbi:hypothetical protein D3C75_831510 [compost metagenome]
MCTPPHSRLPPAPRSPALSPPAGHRSAAAGTALRTSRESAGPAGSSGRCSPPERRFLPSAGCARCADSPPPAPAGPPGRRAQSPPPRQCTGGYTPYPPGGCRHNRGWRRSAGQYWAGSRSSRTTFDAPFSHAGRSCWPEWQAGTPPAGSRRRSACRPWPCRPAPYCTAPAPAHRRIRIAPPPPASAGRRRSARWKRRFPRTPYHWADHNPW